MQKFGGVHNYSTNLFSVIHPTPHPFVLSLRPPAVRAHYHREWSWQTSFINGTKQAYMRGRLWTSQSLAKAFPVALSVVPSSLPPTPPPTPRHWGGCSIVVSPVRLGGGPRQGEGHPDLIQQALRLRTRLPGRIPQGPGVRRLARWVSGRDSRRGLPARTPLAFHCSGKVRLVWLQASLRCEIYGQVIPVSVPQFPHL